MESSRGGKWAAIGGVGMALVTSLSSIVVAIVTNSGVNTYETESKERTSDVVQELAEELVAQEEALDALSDELAEERVWRQSLQDRVNRLEDRTARSGGGGSAISRTLDLAAVEEEQTKLNKERAKLKRTTISADDPRLQKYLEPFK